MKRTRVLVFGTTDTARTSTFIEIGRKMNKLLSLLQFYNGEVVQRSVIFRLGLFRLAWFIVPRVVTISPNDPLAREDAFFTRSLPRRYDRRPTNRPILKRTVNGKTVGDFIWTKHACDSTAKRRPLNYRVQLFVILFRRSLLRVSGVR